MLHFVHRDTLTAGPRSGSQQASGSLSRPKPVMTHGGGGDHDPSPLKLPRWALNQICSKPRGNPSGTKTKIKGLFFLQGPYPLFTMCFSLLMLLLSRAESRKLPHKNPSMFTHEETQAITGTCIQGEKQYNRNWLTLSCHSVCDPIT